MIAITDALPAVVVCEPHIQTQWREKIEAFTTLRVHCIKGTRPYDLPIADVYVFRYTQIAGWVDIITKGLFKFAVYDEPQALRTGERNPQRNGCSGAERFSHILLRAHGNSDI